MTRNEVLEKALACVNGDRDAQYGKPENSFDTIAKFWTVYINAAVAGETKVDIKVPDVAAMLALLKLARISAGVYKADNWVDLAGYAACGGEVESGGQVEINRSDFYPMPDLGPGVINA